MFRKGCRSLLRLSSRRGAWRGFCVVFVVIYPRQFVSIRSIRKIRRSVGSRKKTTARSVNT